jgi:sec-independent protein translocase protein TatC
MARTSKNAEMPFLDHLEELRWRILWSLLAVVIGVGVAFFVLQKFDVFVFLERPVLPFLNGQKLKYTHVADPFSILINASLSLGIVMAAPVVLYQAWAFLAPALYQNEKRLVLPVIFGAILLFIAGVSLSFFIVLPLAIRWLIGIAPSEAMEPMLTLREYMSFAVNMSLAFGVCFELPIAILLLASLGIVTPQFLRRYRRHAFVLCLVGGAFLSPGDLIYTTLLLAGPLYALYELSVLLATMVYRRRQKRALADAGEVGAPA